MSVSLSLVGGRVVEGEVFAVDPLTSTLVLRNIDSNSNSNFMLINASHIVQVDGSIDLTNNLPTIAESGPGVNGFEKYEFKASEQFDKNLQSLNSDVTPQIQTLFDRLNFIFACEWSGRSILVLNEFIIDPPYDKVQSARQSNHATGNLNDNASGLDRVIKVLEGERRKLKL